MRCVKRYDQIAKRCHLVNINSFKYISENNNHTGAEHYTTLSNTIKYILIETWIEHTDILDILSLIVQ